jgi:hypothetical protein
LSLGKIHFDDEDVEGMIVAASLNCEANSTVFKMGPMAAYCFEVDRHLSSMTTQNLLNY